MPFVQPIIGQIVTSLQEAFALAIGSTFWVGIVAALVAAAFALLLRNPKPLATSEAASSPVRADDYGQASVAR